MTGELYGRFVRWMRDRSCASGNHDWIHGYGLARRACRHCKRREIAVYEWRGHYSDYREHTYPLDADPTKDPTPIVRGGAATTVGTEAMLNQIFAEAAKKRGLEATT